jgi:signal transduction histidine kinase
MMILIITIMQYKEEANDYHKKRLLRKEDAVKAHINSILNNTSYEVIPEKLPYIFAENDYIGEYASELSRIHKMPINIYDLDGCLLVSSRKFFKNKVHDSLTSITPSIIDKIDSSPEKRYVIKGEDEGIDFQSSFSFIYDRKSKPIAILHLPYIADNKFYKKELEEFLGNLAKIYLLMFLLSIITAYLLSRYITKSLNTVNQMLKQTSFNSSSNKKIIIKNPNDEINQLIQSYNEMVDKLEESAKKLAQTEREQAWRNMARQVAHEIKNPLTPMRLNIQSFQMSFNPNDPGIKNKFSEFSNMLIDQIDLMSKIATSFSDFAKMPKAQLLEGNLVETIKNTVNLYDASEVSFITNVNSLTYYFDKNQIQRVITNLIKNGLQSVSNNKKSNIKVELINKDKTIIIKVKDNGSGIPEENKLHIFEPKFTTKSSGMGLGLSIVKKIVENHNGTISFDTEKEKGTVFIIVLTKN